MTDPVSSRAVVAAALDRLAAERRVLVVADFDGTLAAGTRDPAAAVIEPSSQRALRRLAGVAARQPGRLHVAILTGRTVRDVAARARVGGIEYLGDHGLQSATLARGARAASIVAVVEPGFDGHAITAEALATGVADELGRPPWLFVERKGPSVAFHVRQADDVPAARSAVLAAVTAVEARADLGEHGLTPYRGRSVVDLRPADAGGKREAMERLLEREGPGAVLVLGDDLSDADAFDAAHEAVGGAGPSVAVCVAVHGRVATPPEILERADLVVASATAVGRLLGGLARRLEPRGRPVRPSRSLSRRS